MYDFLTWFPWVLPFTLKSDKHGPEWSRVAHQDTGRPALGQRCGNNSGRQAGMHACPGHNTAAVWRVWATYSLQMELLRDKTDLLPLIQGALEPDVRALDSGVGSLLSLAVGAANQSSSQSRLYYLHALPACWVSIQQVILLLGVTAFPCLPPSRSLKPTTPEIIGIGHQREACLTQETELAVEAQKNLSFQTKRRTRNPTEWQTMTEGGRTQTCP